MKTIYFYRNKEGVIKISKNDNRGIIIGYFETFNRDIIFDYLFKKYTIKGKEINIPQQEAVREIKGAGGFLHSGIVDVGNINSKYYPEIEAMIIQGLSKPNRLMDKFEWLTNTQIKRYLEEKNNLVTEISFYKLGVSLKSLGFEKIRRRMDGTVKTVYPVIKNPTS